MTKIDKRKSKYFVGKITLHAEKSQITDLSEQFGDGSIVINEDVNFRKYTGEFVEICKFDDGITTISFSGCTIVVPTDRINYFTGETYTRC